MQAAHVHVPQNKLMATDLLTAADLDEQSGSAGKLRHLGAAGLALLQQLLQELGGLPAGQYLLAHAPGDPACCLFKALPADMQETMVRPLAAGNRLLLISFVSGLFCWQRLCWAPRLHCLVPVA
jgi:hypothetical protein